MILAESAFGDFGVADMNPRLLVLLPISVLCRRRGIRRLNLAEKQTPVAFVEDKFYIAVFACESVEFDTTDVQNPV